jgi:hypothetical protein|tara:strand:- start:89 stop:355 length:267 start_codon:yes stop_codon:yes gene_type:complete
LSVSLIEGDVPFVTGRVYSVLVFPAGVNHLLSPRKKVVELGVPVALKDAVSVTAPEVADVGVISIKAVSVVSILDTPEARRVARSLIG